MTKYERREGPVDPVFDRAVVVGSGVGGLAAAAALKDHCAEVIVCEKDEIPKGAVSRRGVPQDEQLHNILTRAQVHLEELLPGFCDGLRSQGTGDANVSTDTHVYELGTQMPQRDLNLRLMSSWRPRIESVARQLLIEADNVTLRGLTRATGLLTDSANTAVKGVEVETSAGPEVLRASLVIDATGTGSKAHKWLRHLGLEEPMVDFMRVDQWYTSMMLDRPKEFTDDPSFWLTFPTPPNSRGGLVSPLDNDKWYVSLSGHRSDEPPRTFDEMKAYAASLEDPSIAEVMSTGLPLSAPKLFRKTNATWRRYDKTASPLTGFLPLGDSIASLNPLFGQGMSVAAWQASELKNAMNMMRDDTDLVAGTAEYLKRAAEACQAAWALGDLVNGLSPSDKLDGEYWGDLASAIQHDKDLHQRYVGVWHLVEPVETLYSPSFLQKVSAAKLH